MRILGNGFIPVDELHRVDRLDDLAGVLPPREAYGPHEGVGYERLWAKPAWREWLISHPPVSRAGGGAIANTLCLLAALGHECHFVGPCGDDAEADLLADDLQRRGVQPHLRRSLARRTPRFVMVVDTAGQRRTVPDFRNAPPDLSLADHPVPTWSGQPFDWLVTELDFPGLEELAGRCAKHLAFNAQYHHVGLQRRRRMQGVMAASDLVVACEEFARCDPALAVVEAITPEMVDWPGRRVIVTRGAAGLVGRTAPDGDGPVERFAQDVPEAVVPLVDATGAGDALLGALVHQLGRLDSRGCNPPTLAALCEPAQRVAGHACRHWGARGYLDDPTTLAAVRALLNRP